MTELEAEDAQTIHPPSRQPGCRCPDPGRACGCDDDGTTAEPREWSRPDKPTAPTRAPLPAVPAAVKVLELPRNTATPRKVFKP